ncbi:hypothetical protein CAEBREN_30998 [Caenorhabditis brenneri]|uniref:Seven TM Receptor n=1 Tax=Caenorhabditis brenneri TaxID=135651 RepID=G0MSD0_CAEBE|nr:hypothetical protein CAEBREN_30998 [Caenorhabditis brenneri]
MSLLSFNFVYRYSIIHDKGCGRYWYVWPMISGFLLLTWICAAIFFVLPCDYFDFYFRDSVHKKYGLETMEIGYYAVVYVKENELTGLSEFYSPSVFCLGLVAFCQMITGCLIVFCGYYLYRNIKIASNFVSGVAAKVHKDLFWTLVLQTITPCFLVYIPGSILIVAPLLDTNADINKIEEIQPLLISIFPIIDTIIILVCFRGFRKALIGMYY